MNNSTVSNIEISNPITTQSLNEYRTATNMASVHNVVRTNANGYPYVTFISKDNVADNVYFAKTISAKYKAGQAVNKALFADLQIGMTTNADGEQRVKLIPIGASTRLSTEDLF